MSAHLKGDPPNLLLALLMVFAFILETVSAENLCKKSPRPPPRGCCPKEYQSLCCLGTRLCGERRPPPSNSTLTPSYKNNATMFNSFINGNGSSPSGLPGKPPCSPPQDTVACQGGFYEKNGTAEPCPPGFFCPELQRCIIPCPNGAYCMQLQKKVSKPRPFAIKPCYRIGMCCMKGSKETPPSVVKRNSKYDYECPGKSIPDACPKGYFCPNPITRKICPKDHYCQEGSVYPKKCPLMTTCKKGESAPLKNAAGPLLAIFILVMFVLVYLAFVYRRVIRFYVHYYWTEVAGRDRSFSRAFNLEGAMKRFVSELQDIEDGVEREKIVKKDFTIDVKFEELSLTLKSHGNKMVLSGVTGAINSGEVTAVMGPSGAGKTTFLNALSGKAYYGNLGGKIKINDKEVDDIKKFRKITGFVPQEDIMHRALTVKEVLLYQGRLRLPGSVSLEDIKEKVSQILELLEIDHVKDVPIGDEETRGISGGQRKRVNIGMELVGDPTLLFLDEPTSGLDSTSSLSVLRALRAVAEKGRLTVICVIHQPRYEIFSMFHKLLFLGPGGRTVYQGTVAGAEEYFKNMGFVVPANVNPADFYMDVIGGVIKKDGEKVEPIKLFNAWDKYRDEHSDVNQNIEGELEVEKSNTGEFEDRPLPNFFAQFLTFLIRENFLQFRYMKSLLLDLGLVLLAGGVLGGLYSDVTLEKLNGMNTMSSLAIGLTAMLASLRCFGNHRTTFWREAATGVNRFSYFMAVNVCQLPVILLTPLIYLSLQYTFTAPRALFRFHYLVVLMAQFATTGMGYAISCTFNPRNSQMASVVLVLISSLLSGSMPSICQLNDFTVVGPIIYNLSYCRWFVEALFEKEVQRYPPVLQTKIDVIAYNNNYQLDNYFVCVAVLFVFGIVSRLIAFLCLVFTNRGKQQ